MLTVCLADLARGPLMEARLLIAVDRSEQEAKKVAAYLKQRREAQVRQAWKEHLRGHH